jgi:predicted aspartyl protease
MALPQRPRSEAIMELSTMGKVLVTAKIENLFDVENRERGVLPADQVRTVEVTDALVDTGATTLLLPKRLITQLGLRSYRTRPSRTIGGTVPLSMYTAVRLTVQGRDCINDVGEIPDEFTVVIGQVPLELMDWVVDPKGQRLIGNPAHGGEHIIEV